MADLLNLDAVITGYWVESINNTVLQDWTQTVTPNQNTDYTLWIHYLDANGTWVDQEINTVHVILLPGLTAINFTTNPPNQIACFGQPIDITAEAAPTGSSYSYVWSTGGNSNTISPTPTTTTTYTVTATDINSGCSMEEDVTIQMTDLAATITSTVDECANQCEQTATVTPSGGVPPYTYLWDANAQTTQTATNLCEGSTYNCTVTDAGGCSVVATVTLTLPPNIQYYTGTYATGTWSPANLAPVQTYIIDHPVFVYDPTIPPVTSLNIDNFEVQFTPTGRFVIISSFMLKITNGSILHANPACSGNMWPGITVYGNPGLPQNPPNFPDQGCIFIDNSTISDMLKGIQVQGGGIIQTDNNARFIDNRRSIVMDPYLPSSQSSKILNSHFLTDGPLLNPSVLPDKQVLIIRNKFTNVSANYVVAGNVFENTIPAGSIPVADRGMGLVFRNSDFYTFDNTFNGSLRNNPVFSTKIDYIYQYSRV